MRIYPWLNVMITTQNHFHKNSIGFQRYLFVFFIIYISPSVEELSIWVKIVTYLENTV